MSNLTDAEIDEQSRVLDVLITLGREMQDRAEELLPNYSVALTYLATPLRSAGPETLDWDLSGSLTSRRDHLKRHYT